MDTKVLFSEVQLDFGLEEPFEFAMCLVSIFACFDLSDVCSRVGKYSIIGGPVSLDAN
jgi:hypothetical protein